MYIDPEQQKKSKIDRYHHGNLRQAVLDLGLEMLAQIRAQDLSVRQIATQLGVSDTAIYRYFKNKEALLVALAIEGFTRLNQMQVDNFTTTFQRGGSAREAFAAGGWAYVNFARTHAELFRLMFGGLASGNKYPELTQACRENSALTTESIGRLVGNRVDEQALRAYGIGVRSFMHGMSMLWIDGYLGDTAQNETELEALALAAFDGSMWAIPD